MIKKVLSVNVIKVILFLALLLLPGSLFGFNLRAGFYGSTQFPIGEASTYFKNASGTGLAVEFGFLENFGQSMHFQWAGIIPKNDKILSAWQLVGLLGLWYNLPLGNAGFSVQPSIEAGLMYQGAKIQDGYGELPQRAYTDFILQICPSFRYKNEKMLNNHLEIELSPIWSIVPQNSGGLVFAGARLGILYVTDL